MRRAALSHGALRLGEGNQVAGFNPRLHVPYFFSSPKREALWERLGEGGAEVRLPGVEPRASMGKVVSAVIAQCSVRISRLRRVWVRGTSPRMTDA